ncbi:MAG: CBS domain-containing protein [bacterium]|nr:CBS domain-containing protein [bacterium]
MKKREPISHIMTKNVHFVNQNETLENAVKLIKENNIHHLPVMNGRNVIGIISSTDINRLTFGKLFEHQEGSEAAMVSSLTLEQVMTAQPQVVQSDLSIKEVAEIFASANFHALPVLENDQLVGIVTTTDMIKYLIEQY